MVLHHHQEYDNHGRSRVDLRRIPATKWLFDAGPVHGQLSQLHLVTHVEIELKLVRDCAVVAISQLQNEAEV